MIASRQGRLSHPVMTKNNPIVFFGTPDFAARVLKGILQSGLCVAAVISMPDRPQGRGYQLMSTPVKQMAISSNIACYQPENAVQLQALLEGLEPFLGLVVAYGMILPSQIVHQFELVNLHASILPRYRGASPIQAALLNGDVETGMTLMKIGEAVDSGDVIAIEHVSIDPLDQAATLTDKLIVASVKLFVDQYGRQTLPWKGKPQDHTLSTMTKKIKREDGLIDLSAESPESIYRKWQAYTPWPGVFVFHEGKRVKLIEVEFQDNKLNIQKVQCEGKSVISYQQFVHGNGSLLAS